MIKILVMASFLILACSSINDGDVIKIAKYATSIYPCGDYQYLYKTTLDETFCSNDLLKVGDTIKIISK